MSITCSYLAAYYRGFFSPVDTEHWQIHIIYNDFVNLETALETIIDCVNANLRSDNILLRWQLKAKPLDRVEGGIDLVGVKDHSWSDFGTKFDVTAVQDKANIRLVMDQDGSSFQRVGSTAALLKFKAYDGCPKAFMLLMDYVFTNMKNVIIVHRTGFPDDDEAVWLGGVGDRFNCPIFPCHIRITGSNSRLIDLRREFDER